MAQTSYTPILLYSSTTPSQAPAAGNLINSTLGSEVAINITDGKLFYKDNTNAVQVIAWKTTPTTAGGTGLTSYTAGDLPYYATGTTLSKLAIGTAGQILTSTGTAPQWSTLSGVAVTTFSAGTTGFTPSVATSGAITLAGTLATTNGGTGLTSFTANAVLYSSSTSALATSANLYFNGTNFGIGCTPIVKSQTSIGTNRRFSIFLNGSDSVFGFLDDAGNWVDTFINGAPLRFGYGGTERAQIDSAGNFKITTGNLVIATSGKGIDFSATPGTGTSELFADYEEGTWTPTMTSASGTTTVNAVSGRYTKIGDHTFVVFEIDYSTNASVGTSTFTIDGLPFTSRSSFSSRGFVTSSNWSGSDYNDGYMTIGSAVTTIVWAGRSVDQSNRTNAILRFCADYFTG